MSVRSFTVVIFTLFSFSVQAQNADINLLRSINVHRDRSLDGAMNAITSFDYPVSIALPAAQVIIGLARHDNWTLTDGLQTTAALALNAVITEGLKYAVHRPRPFVTYPDIQPYETYRTNSFPSGHASFAFCTATALFICYPRWYVAVPAYLWAGAVGYSRLFLGVHYPSDVLAGAVIGAGSAWISHRVNMWLLHRRFDRQFPQEI